MTGNVVDTIKKIREGFLDPKEISTSDRRVCVAYLRLEGCTQEEIAEILKVSRQTIIRDEPAETDLGLAGSFKLILHVSCETGAGRPMTFANLCSMH